MNASRITNSLLIGFAVVIMFIYGKPLILPFVIALIFWFLVKEIRDLFNKVEFINKKIPNIILNLLGFAIIFCHNRWHRKNINVEYSASVKRTSSLSEKYCGSNKNDY